MNDIQRKLLEDKIKWMCNDCKTVFETEEESLEEKIDAVTEFVIRRDLKMCYNCEYFLTAYNSQFEETEGECTFGCSRPQTPNGYCKVFKGRFS